MVVSTCRGLVEVGNGCPCPFSTCSDELKRLRGLPKTQILSLSFHPSAPGGFFDPKITHFSKLGEKKWSGEVIEGGSERPK